MYKKIITVLLVLLLFFILFKVIRVQEFAIKMIYKTEYSEYVELYSEKYKVDENLVYAVIKAESNFEVNATSNKGAKGLMQLLDSTATELANELNLEYETQKLYIPNINIELGIKYLSNLMEKYNQNYLLAVTAYNAGIGNVDKWLEKKIIDGTEKDVANIPFEETKKYVKKIIINYKIYKYMAMD